MIYVLYGTEDFLIKRKVKQIKQENNFEECDITEFNLEETDLKSIIDDASTLSLFSTKRMIIVENSYIFTGANKKSQDTKPLELYINHPNASTVLIFIVPNEKLDNRKKIVTLVKNKGFILEFNEVTNMNQLIKEMLGPYKMDSMNIRLFIDRVGNNLNLINQEINKMKTYKGDNLDITKEDIINITTKTVDIDIFHLIDNIILNHKEQALESYYEMLKMGEEPIKIIVMLANQFRLMYQTKKLKMKGISIFEMMSILGQKKFTLEKSLEKGRNISEEKIIKNIKALANLDLAIKSGRIDKNIGLELFILEQ